MSPVIVITGPSATGKTTVLARLLELFPEAGHLITTTTRSQRPTEQHGRDYWFISREEFEVRKAASEFVEWVETYGNYYGSSAKQLSELRNEHPFVLILLDMRGARTYATLVPGTHVIFISPGSIDDLRRRLGERASSTSPHELERRIGEIQHEIDTAHQFSTVVKNIDGKLEDTVRQAADIIRGILANNAKS